MSPSTDVSIVAPIESDLARVRVTQDAATSPATRRAYDLARRHYGSFCTARGWVPYPESPTQYIEQVLQFLQDKVDQGVSTSTIVKTVSGLKWHATREAFAAAVALQMSPDLRSFTQGVARLSKARTVRRARALSVLDLFDIHEVLERKGTVLAVRNRALVSLGIGAALRADSLADLTVADITPATSRDALNVRLRWSKTDQTAEGRVITVARSRRTAIDPVRAVEQWLAVLASRGITAATHPEHPLFPSMKGNVIRASKIANANEALTDLLRDVVEEAGMPENHGVPVSAWSSHSLRSTFVTLSAAAHVPEAAVQSVTGHRNLNTLRGYDRTSGEAVAQARYLG